MSGWIMAPIFRTFSRTAVEIPDDCTAMTSAMGATPVAIVSTVTFRSRWLSRSRKSEASRRSTERPFASVTVTGTSTRRERTSKRESCAVSGTTNASRTAYLIIVCTAFEGPLRPVRALLGCTRRSLMPLRHGAGIEGGERVGQAPMLRPGLAAAAGHIEDQAEKLPAEFFNAGAARGNAAGVEIDQVRPLLRQRGA